jgi:uncharacterized membrane protein YeiH
MTWVYLLDLLGTAVFAISGVLTATHKKFDLVGTFIVGFVTAIGGGTLRDILIGRFPVGWLLDRNYFIAIVVGYLLATLFREHVVKFRRSMFLFDTLGISLFTIIGIQIAADAELNYEFCLMMGVISACFGGVIRDVLTNEIPLIFRREIYASACLVGGIVFLVMNQFSSWNNLNIIVSVGSVFAIRYFAIKNGWTLNFSKHRENDQ